MLRKADGGLCGANSEKNLASNLQVTHQSQAIFATQSTRKLDSGPKHDRVSFQNEGN